MSPKNKFLSRVPIRTRACVPSIAARDFATALREAIPFSRQRMRGSSPGSARSSLPTAQENQMNRRHAAVVLMTSVVFSLSAIAVVAQQSKDAMKGMSGAMHMDAGHAPAGAAAAKVGDLDISGGFV